MIDDYNKIYKGIGGIMKNIIITGSAGFIASSIIVEFLKDNSNNITGIDNFKSSTKKNLDFISSLVKNKKIQLIEANIRNIDILNIIINENNINQLYHLPVIVSVQESIYDKSKIEKILDMESFINFNEGIITL